MTSGSADRGRVATNRAIPPSGMKEAISRTWNLCFSTCTQCDGNRLTQICDIRIPTYIYIYMYIHTDVMSYHGRSHGWVSHNPIWVPHERQPQPMMDLFDRWEPHELQINGYCKTACLYNISYFCISIHWTKVKIEINIYIYMSF